MRRCRARSLFRPLSEVHLGAGDRPFCHEGRLGEAVRGGKSRLRQGMRLPFRSRIVHSNKPQTAISDQLVYCTGACCSSLQSCVSREIPRRVSFLFALQSSGIRH